MCVAYKKYSKISHCILVERLGEARAGEVQLKSARKVVESIQGFGCFLCIPGASRHVQVGLESAIALKSLGKVLINGVKKNTYCNDMVDIDQN